MPEPLEDVCPCAGPCQAGREQSSGETLGEYLGQEAEGGFSLSLPATRDDGQAFVWASHLQYVHAELVLGKHPQRSVFDAQDVLTLGVYGYGVHNEVQKKIHKHVNGSYTVVACALYHSL